MSAAVQPVPGLSLLDAFGAVLRFRRLVVATAIVFAFIVAIIVFLMPRTYSSSASFTPQSTRANLSGLGGLAAQLGVAIPAGESNQSPAFYADLLRSRTILEPLVNTPFEFTAKGEKYRGTFIQLAKLKGDSAHRTEAAIKKIRQSMAVSVSPKTGVVQLELKTRYAALSALLTQKVLALVNEFNVQSRRSQAAAQRLFLEQRFASVSDELRRAEEAARDFALQNRGDISGSPQLALRQERLNRDVSLRSQVVATLSTALEQAKLDEIRDTPLITITEAPSMPAQPDPRGLIVKTLLALIVGLFIGSVVALLRQAVAANRRQRPESFAELSAEFAAAKSDLMRLVFPRRRIAAGNGRSETRVTVRHPD